jgi:hypothetical protein
MPVTIVVIVIVVGIVFGFILAIDCSDLLLRQERAAEGCDQETSGARRRSVGEKSKDEETGERD